MMVAQSPPQLKERYPYEVWKEIIGCCALTLVWGAAEKETAEYVSQLLGPATVEQISLRRKTGTLDSAQITVSHRGRALLDASEVRRLSFDEGIALVLGANPLRFKKVPYKKHPYAYAMTPVRKYVPLRERQVETKDIRVESSSSSGGWEGFIN